MADSRGEHTAATDAGRADISGRYNRELSVLNAVSRALSATVDLEEILQTALERVAELLELRTSWIFLYDEESGRPRLAGSLNLPPALADTPAAMQGWCYCLESYHAGDMAGAANVNVIRCSRLKELVDGTDGLRYHSSIPLYAHGKRLGVLNVAATNWRELSADDLRLLHTVGDVLSLAIERALLFRHSRHIGALEERNRLSREIHDTLAQGLTGVALQLEALDALAESGGDMMAFRSAVQRALRLTRAAIEEARRSVLDLRAAPLDERSLAEALRALCAETAHAAAATADCRIQPGLQIPQRYEQGVYRIAQEALANVRRHAQARTIGLRLYRRGNTLHLRIEDDGKGFDSAAAAPAGFGLQSMRERARLLGATLALRSAPGRGTAIHCRIPLERALHTAGGKA